MILKAVLLLAFFVIDVRYLQDTLLFRAAPAPLDADRCPSCGGMMDQLELDLLERRPLELR